MTKLKSPPGPAGANDVKDGKSISSTVHPPVERRKKKTGPKTNLDRQLEERRPHRRRSARSSMPRPRPACRPLGSTLMRPQRSKTPRACSARPQREREGESQPEHLHCLRELSSSDRFHFFHLLIRSDARRRRARADVLSRPAITETAPAEAHERTHSLAREAARDAKERLAARERPPRDPDALLRAVDDLQLRDDQHHQRHLRCERAPGRRRAQPSRTSSSVDGARRPRPPVRRSTTRSWVSRTGSTRTHGSRRATLRDMTRAGVALDPARRQAQELRRVSLGCRSPRANPRRRPHRRAPASALQGLPARLPAAHRLGEWIGPGHDRSAGLAPVMAFRATRPPPELARGIRPRAGNIGVRSLRAARTSSRSRAAIRRSRRTT